jgi:hypothetical protein
MMRDNIPEWLNGGVPSEDQAKGQLVPSRKEMYKALELYYTHVKYVITIMFSFLTALFAILGLSQKLGSDVFPLETIRVVVSVALITLFPLALLAILIILRYYEVYVSSLIFALRVHLGANMVSAHPWLVRTLKQAKTWIEDIKCDGDFLRKRALSLKDTFFLYACVIILLGALSVFCGLKILGVEILEILSNVVGWILCGWN